MAACRELPLRFHVLLAATTHAGWSGEEKEEGVKRLVFLRSHATPRRPVALVAASLLVFVGLAIPAGASLDVPSVMFTIRPDSALIGAGWLLNGYDAETELESTVVASGVVASTGPLTIAVPIVELTGLTPTHFEWSALRAIDRSRGLISVRGGGLAPSRLMTTP